jgi:hypothetical protein
MRGQLSKFHVLMGVRYHISIGHPLDVQDVDDAVRRSGDAGARGGGRAAFDDPWALTPSQAIGFGRNQSCYGSQTRTCRETTRWSPQLRLWVWWAAPVWILWPVDFSHEPFDSTLGRPALLFCALFCIASTRSRTAWCYHLRECEACANQLTHLPLQQTNNSKSVRRLNKLN